MQADYQENADYTYEKTFALHTPLRLTETTPQAGDKDKVGAMLRQPEGESATVTVAHTPLTCYVASHDAYPARETSRADAESSVMLRQSTGSDYHT